MGAKLLLADDSVTIQKVVELTLADEDYEITTVSDGAAALEKAEALHPSLILADIVMPELNGYELCEKVRQNSALANTPVILLSSTFETYDESRGASVGADDHIVKPFESDELSRKIRDWLEKKTGQGATTEADTLQEQEVLRSLEASVKDEEPEPEIVDEEAFEFELTDEFMEEAEEMFEEPEELPTADNTPEEVLPEETLIAEEPVLSDVGTGEEVTAEQASSEMDWTSEVQPPEEITPDLMDESTSWKPAEEEEQPEEEMAMEIPPADAEIDSALLEEEEVNVYEIPEEFAESESEDLTLEESPAEETIEETATYNIEDAPVDLIDEFMAAEETVETSEEVAEGEQDLTETEILEAVEEEQPEEISVAGEETTSFEAGTPEGAEAVVEEQPAFGEETPEVTDDIVEEPALSEITEAEVAGTETSWTDDTAPAESLEEAWTTEKSDETGEEIESFDAIYPTQGATTSEWSPEVTSFGGEPEEVAEDVVEKPLQADAAPSPVPAVTEETLRRMVQEMVDEKAAEIIERVAWEVIPDLAEVMIQKEIQRLQQEVEHS